MASTDTTHRAGPRLRMPGAVAAALACPVCTSGLEPRERGLSCDAGHSFDVAREGYAALLTGATPPGSGDTKEMVADRLRFQQAGHYEPLAGALADTLARELTVPAPLVADIGGGTGHYLARVLDALPDAVGLTVDVSKFAARKAARAHERGGAVTADAWRALPLRQDCADALLNVFAPRGADEFHRVLRPGGVLLVVTPAADHLAELRGPLGLLEVDPRKDERLADTLHGRFAPDGTRELRFPLELTRADTATVVGMGPSARHIDPAALHARIAALPEPVAATASVRLHTYRPR
ncbi:23S rRNA (guanine745-N1)-methyltransferase [Nocardiopsis algeriensis]|uniref:23S rRNA (Guanine745-N1)-methyltransferase n=2 Tax=Nocardiopsis algeriensis TaxID=1478215 RepID=A0A841IM93_9ACTN|nr:methyltransferase domain-containing protein [Nocardiopsis algeriensis]MBB6119857.1 23S rRNA (guanine745-N1)-methyltransferase [Nocardiopsis algeriensis]